MKQIILLLKIRHLAKSVAICENPHGYSVLMKLYKQLREELEK